MADRVTFADLLKKSEEKKQAEREKLEVTEVTSSSPSSLSTGSSFSTSSSRSTGGSRTTTSTPTTDDGLESPTIPIYGKNKRSYRNILNKKSTLNEDIPVAPTRDFQKVTNSITREAIPNGIFKSGKCKQLYDALYSVTRGAINPQRKVRINKPRLMKLAGIGTRETLWQNLKHLEIVGLIETKTLNGEHGGNEYTVYLPEELSITGGSPTTPSSPSNPAYSYQNLPLVPVVENSPSTTSLSPINTVTSDLSKTSLKTNATDDDLPLTGFIAKIEAASIKLTGKGFSKKEAKKWENLADLLILELETAASRTDGISSVPAFLTEVLRRQFFISKQIVREHSKPISKNDSKSQPDVIGKSNSVIEEAYEIKALDEKGREAAFFQLEEFKDENFLNDFAKWYTPADWQWLIKRLNISTTNLDKAITEETVSSDENNNLERTSEE